MPTQALKAKSNSAVDSVVAMTEKAHAADALGAYERGVVLGELLAIQKHMAPDADRFDAALTKVQALCAMAASTEHDLAMARLES
jgi:hypothetical protein